jgi:hypothetical protein
VFCKRLEKKFMGNDAVRMEVETEAAFAYIMELVWYQHRRTLKTIVIPGTKAYQTHVHEANSVPFL